MVLRQGPVESVGLTMGQSPQHSMPSFWQGRRVFVTGHTGFKGAWLCLWLERLGAKVTAYALPPATDPSLYGLAGPWAAQTHVQGDLADARALTDAMHRADPQVVLHLAAQALVRPGYRDPVGTFTSNVMGTVNVLEAARTLAHRPQAALQAVVSVTSDKVYDNPEHGLPFHEGDSLGGKDPYSASKACAELVTRCWRDSFFTGTGTAVATARAGNVIGGGDWAEARLIPDLIRSLDSGSPLVIRYPQSVRPWQHVLEPLAGYLRLAQALVETPDSAPQAVNFGPPADAFLTVAELLDAFAPHVPEGRSWIPDPAEQPPEAGHLTLDHGLATRTLGWQPRLTTAQTVDWTARWYSGWRAGQDARALTLSQIEQYQDLLP